VLLPSTTATTQHRLVVLTNGEKNHGKRCQMYRTRNINYPVKETDCEHKHSFTTFECYPRLTKWPVWVTFH